jgi:hypothetical protein
MKTTGSRWVSGTKMRHGVFDPQINSLEKMRNKVFDPQIKNNKQNKKVINRWASGLKCLCKICKIIIFFLDFFTLIY